MISSVQMVWRKKKFKCWIAQYLSVEKAICSDLWTEGELNQYFFSSPLLVRQDYNTLWWNILGVFSCSRWRHLLITQMVMLVCEGALTSCPDFVLGNYVLAFLMDVEYGIFLCSISVLDSLVSTPPNSCCAYVGFTIISEKFARLLTSQKNKRIALRLDSS